MTIGAIVVSCVLYRKANNLQVAVSRKSDNLLVDASGFMVRVITQKITGGSGNYFSTYIGEDGKLHEAVMLAPVTISGKADITAGAFIKGAILTPVIISGNADIKAEIKKGE